MVGKRSARVLGAVLMVVSVLLFPVECKKLPVKQLLRAGHRSEQTAWFDGYVPICSTKRDGQIEKYRALLQDQSVANSQEDLIAKHNALKTFLRRCSNKACPETSTSANELLESLGPGMQRDLLNYICLPQYENAPRGLLPHPECVEYPKNRFRLEVGLEAHQVAGREDLVDHTRKTIDRIESLDCLNSIKAKGEEDAWKQFMILVRRLEGFAVRKFEAEWIIDSLALFTSKYLSDFRESICPDFNAEHADSQENGNPQQQFTKDGKDYFVGDLKVLCQLLPEA